MTPDAAGLNQWLLSDARRLEDPCALLEEVANRLRAAGVPAWRMTLHQPLLHPQLAGALYEWREGGKAERRTISRQLATTDVFHRSPVGLMRRTERAVRRKLSGAEANPDFPLLEELAAEGGTDYALYPLPFGRGLPGGVGLTTRLARGFPEAALELVEAILPTLATVLEILATRDMARGLLDVYVGRQAGGRIFDGQVTLGSSRTIDAIIVFCDMRDYTILSETLSRRALLDLLGDYFAAMLEPIGRAGGEVLKFMGDGVLAIFELQEDMDEAEASARAMIAALEAVEAMRLTNIRRANDGKRSFEAGISLHRGEVVYGNIGWADRLDFTVIGPAVNRAARIQALCSVLGRPILTSRAFARACPVSLISVGRHRLRGVEKEQEIYAPGTAIPA